MAKVRCQDAVVRVSEGSCCPQMRGSGKSDLSVRQALQAQYTLEGDGGVVKRCQSILENQQYFLGLQLVADQRKDDRAD